MLTETSVAILKFAFVKLGGQAIINKPIQGPMPSDPQLPPFSSFRVCFRRGSCSCFSRLANKAMVHFSHKSSGGSPDGGKETKHGVSTTYQEFTFKIMCKCFHLCKLSGVLCSQKESLTGKRTASQLVAFLSLYWISYSMRIQPTPTSAEGGGFQLTKTS